MTVRSHTEQAPTRDGVRLATDVHLPADGPGPEGLTFVLRTPYGRRGGFDAVPELAAYLTSLGHVLVSQDVRGKFDSEGQCRPFRQELDDGRDLVEWIAEQPWSAGRLVPTGESYCGFTALTAAASRHPSIVGVMAGMTTSRVVTDWLYRDRAFRLQLNAEWIAMSFGQRALPETLPWAIDGWGRVSDVTDVDTRGADLSALRELRSVPIDRDGDTELAGGLTDRCAGVADVPIVLWTGYWDPLARGTIEEFRSAAALRPGQAHHLELAPTDHLGNPWEAALRRASTQADRASSLVGCYRRNLPHLLAAVDGATGRRGPRVTYQDQRGQAFQSAHWPPVPGDVAVARFDEPVVVPAPTASADLPGSGETFVWGSLAADFPDERATTERDDVVVVRFDADEVAGSLELAGEVRWNGAARIVATLAQKQPDGRILRVAEGVAARPVGQDAGSGGPEPLLLDLGPVCHRDAGGAGGDRSWMLILAQEAYPRYLPVAQADAWIAGPADRHLPSPAERSDQRIVLTDLTLRTVGGLP